MVKSQVKENNYCWKKQFFPEKGKVKPIGDTFCPVEEAGAAPLLLRMIRAAESPGRRLVFAAPTVSTAEAVRTEFERWCRAVGFSTSTLLLPDGPFRDQAAACSDSPRAKALDQLLTTPPSLVFASAAGLLAPVPAVKVMRDDSLLLKRGDELAPEELAKRLALLDYDDEAEVTAPGEFARRGGLIDVFSPAEDLPVRIEYFGDTVDSLRKFSPEDQLSRGEVESCRIIPRSGNAAVTDRSAPSGEPADYLDGEQTDLILFHPDDIGLQLQRFAPTEAEHWKEFIKKFHGRTTIFADEVEGADRHCSTPPFFALHTLLMKALPEGVEYGFSELARQVIASMIRRWIEEEDVRVRLLWRTETDRVNMCEWLAESELTPGPNLELESGDVPCGLFLPEQGLAVLTEQELFATPLRMRGSRAGMPRADRAGEAAKAAAEADKRGELSAFADLDEGDYAVHLNYGICIYRGLQTIETGGARAEMIALEFADDATVHIPVWQAHYLARYIGSKKAAVTLSSIRSGKWGKTKAAASLAVRNLAYEMLKMQAMRSSIQGAPFPHDDLNQRLFEQAFPYQETPDQLRSAEEIKRDMESDKPMDRLLCGDVGYGKTELAMRASYKCVMAGRQAAVLVPTTVLAQQHYYSFLERFAGTPVIIEQLSRFRTKKEQAGIVQRMMEGTVDIVIGTHRLLQDDIKFKDLGLIVVDEEQRFGVAHKERLKRLRASVDILTMTATPIPRTLYLSMAGMRDLSTLMSAPVQRLPVQTLIVQDDPGVIRNAVARELQRGGQVYFLHNRVSTIENEAIKLQAMFPRAKIGIGHGQMPEEQLENVMSNFIEGKLDILVCTTIIESGLDIPNANTIIIDRADRFGLAELYQLRGRVGRWTRQAYAYLLLPRSGILTGDARKRIAALRRYTHLGAGFKLAMSDLQIRGAGNILGEEQSGQINAVGFYLYCDLLKSCIEQLNGAPPEPRPETDLRLDFLEYAQKASPGRLAASFPPDYINAPKLRLDAYRKLASIGVEERLDAFERELIDRYGPLPDAAKHMLTTARIRIEASRKKIESVSVYDGKAIMERGTRILKPSGMVPRVPSSLTPAGKLARVLELVRAAEA